MNTEKLYESWAGRNPYWEIRYEPIIKTYCDYGKGATSLRESRGKLFGGGYELFIIAFFIGLYFDKKKTLIDDSSKKKQFGQPIRFWGNLDSVKDRKAYPKLREFIFVSLIAKTELDFIALDKDEISLQKAVSALMQTMEEYANFGFNYIEDKINENPNHFYSETAFLELFMSFGTTDNPEELSYDNEPESLD